MSKVSITPELHLSCTYGDPSDAEPQALFYVVREPVYLSIEDWAFLADAGVQAAIAEPFTFTETAAIDLA